MQLTVTADDDKLISVDVRTGPPLDLRLSRLTSLRCIRSAPHQLAEASGTSQAATSFACPLLCVLQMDGEDTVSTLKAILEAETGVASSAQRLQAAGKELADR